MCHSQSVLAEVCRVLAEENVIEMEGGLGGVCVSEAFDEEEHDEAERELMKSMSNYTIEEEDIIELDEQDGDSRNAFPPLLPLACPLPHPASSPVSLQFAPPLPVKNGVG
jgi:hypothetical protein